MNFLEKRRMMYAGRNNWLHFGDDQNPRIFLPDSWLEFLWAGKHKIRSSAKVKLSSWLLSSYFCGWEQTKINVQSAKTAIDAHTQIHDPTKRSTHTKSDFTTNPRRRMSDPTRPDPMQTQPFILLQHSWRADNLDYNLQKLATPIHGVQHSSMLGIFRRSNCFIGTRALMPRRALVTWEWPAAAIGWATSRDLGVHKLLLMASFEIVKVSSQIAGITTIRNIKTVTGCRRGRRMGRSQHLHTGWTRTQGMNRTKPTNRRLQVAQKQQQWQQSCWHQEDVHRGHCIEA